MSDPKTLRGGSTRTVMLKPFRNTLEIDAWLAQVSYDPIRHSDVGVFSCYAYGTRGKVLPFANKCEFWSAI